MKCLISIMTNLKMDGFKGFEGNLMYFLKVFGVGLKVRRGKHSVTTASSFYVYYLFPMIHYYVLSFSIICFSQFSACFPKIKKIDKNPGSFIKMKFV